MLHVSPLSPERVWAMRASGVFMGPGNILAQQENRVTMGLIDWRQPDAGIRRSVEAALARAGQAHDARADRRLSREVVGYRAAEGSESPHGPAWRDKRRQPGPYRA